MIHLIFTPPENQEWNDWVQDCTHATTILIDSYDNGNPIGIQSNLYKRLNHVFYEEPFHGKCAYCECENIQTSPVYVEHYRPKGEVRFMDNTKVYLLGENEVPVPHSGYYWLAYNWVNLLPTCWNCNTWHEDISGQMVGKGNRFPVSNNHTCQINGEVDEEALIINPITENPDIHLSINNLGLISKRGDSEKGRVTIEVFGLNIRETLLNARKREYKSTKMKMKFFLAMDDDHPNKLEELNELIAIRTGSQAFTMAARKAIADEILEVEQKLQDVR